MLLYAHWKNISDNYWTINMPNRLRAGSILTAHTTDIFLRETTKICFWCPNYNQASNKWIIIGWWKLMSTFFTFVENGRAYAWTETLWMGLLRRLQKTIWRNNLFWFCENSDTKHKNGQQWYETKYKYFITVRK